MGDEITVVVRPTGRKVKGREGLQWATFYSPTFSGRMQIPAKQCEWEMCDITLKFRDEEAKSDA